MHRLVGLQLFWSGTPTFSSGTPTFCQMGVLNSCFQNPSESSDMYLLLARSNSIIMPGSANFKFWKKKKIGCVFD